MPTSSTLDEVREYYRENQHFYNLLWTEPQTLSMNYGIWTSGTRTHAEALANQNRLIEELLEPTAGNLILEAGCGMGGACIWFAEQHPVHAYGITICENQAQLATRHARNRGVADRVKFVVADFTQTGFIDATFARIFASESICHAARKDAFLVEAFRLLEPGGCLVVVDGFVKLPGSNDRERQQFEEWGRGWAVPGLATVVDFDRHLRQAGFVDVVYRDLTAEIQPSMKHIRWFGWGAYPILATLHRLGFASRSQVRNARSCILQYGLITSGFWGFGVFRARKPARV
jgi:tocopherol O-methyltransferase